MYGRGVRHNLLKARPQKLATGSMDTGWDLHVVQGLHANRIQLGALTQNAHPQGVCPPGLSVDVCPPGLSL